MARSSQLRVLAFEPFDAGSHRAVREAISDGGSACSHHQWLWITRPGRAWKWRMRLGAAEMVELARRQGGFTYKPDVIFATSLMSASDLRALLPVELRSAPLVIYMHENQAAYPSDVVRWREGDIAATTEFDESAAASRHPPDVQFALTNLISVLAADAAIWNSQWNLRSFFDDTQAILGHAPDLALENWRSRVECKSCVIWPPVVPPSLTEADDALHKPTIWGTGGASTQKSGSPIHVVWPHRWEHDKGPDDLLCIARDHSESMNLRWTILGEQFRNVPAALTAFEREFANRIDHIGFEPDRAEYWRRLRDCDWVLSTARHEFFGIAVVEALLAGCLPWLPSRLSYVEMLPPEARRLSPMNPPGDPHVIRSCIRAHLEPAVASNAVRAIDDVIERVWTNVMNAGT